MGEPPHLWERSTENTATDVNDGVSVIAAMLGAEVQARSGVKRSLRIHLWEFSDLTATHRLSPRRVGLCDREIGDWGTLSLTAMSSTNDYNLEFVVTIYKHQSCSRHNALIFMTSLGRTYD